MDSSERRQRWCEQNFDTILKVNPPNDLYGNRCCLINGINLPFPWILKTADKGELKQIHFAVVRSFYSNAFSSNFFSRILMFYDHDFNRLLQSSPPFVTMMNQCSNNPKKSLTM